MQKSNLFFEHVQYGVQDAAGKTLPPKHTYGANRTLLSKDSGYDMNCMHLYGESEDITLFRLELASAPPHYSLPCRRENCLFLYFVLSGAGQINEQRLQTGDFFSVLPLQEHTLLTQTDEPWQWLCISLYGSYLSRLQKELNILSANRATRFANPEQLRKISEYLLFECPIGEDAQAFAKSILHFYLSYLYLPKDAPSERAPSFSSRQERFVHRATEMIHAELSTVTVNQLAVHLNLDRRYFSQLFRDITGLSPQQYIQNCKMEWIRNALLTTDMSVNEIMVSLGYNHRNSMILAFKKQFGASPSQYRKQHGKNEPPMR